VQAVECPGALCNQILAPLGEQAQYFGRGLRIDRRQALVREAARAVARASSSSLLRALPLESTRTRAESLGGTSTTDSPEPANLTARCLPRPPAFSTAQRRLGNRLAQLSRDLRPKAGAVLREESTLKKLACDLVDRGYG
jgi:hypothetical protein